MYKRSAFWPILNKQHLYDSVYIQITAGSTAMPNENEERMRWIELMPLIMQNIQMVWNSQIFTSDVKKSIRGI